jgi:DNA-binding MarR family transcriptional regulator
MSKKQGVSSVEAHLGYWMRFVSNRVSEEFRIAVEAVGVSVSEWVALRTLYDSVDANHGSLTQALGMTKGAVSKLIARLEEKGLIDRQTVQADARQIGLRLTAAGKALVPRLATLADKNDERFFGHLSAARRRELRQLLEEIVTIHQLSEVPVR